MFASGSTEDVLLGIPASNVEVKGQYVSKIGGVPLWISHEDNMRDYVPEACSYCNTNMLFVMQIYAPVDNLHRVLYIYCCPTSCASKSYGWKVVKDQCAVNKVKNDEEAENMIALKGPNDSGMSQKTDWMKLCADNDNESEDSDDDFSSLSALIDARDDSLRQQCLSVGGNRIVQNLPPPPLQSYDESVALAPLNVSQDMPRKEHLEQFISTAGVMKERALTEIYESECFLTTSISTSHADDLLEKYIEESILNGEEDPGVISLLQQQRQKKAGKESDVDNSDDDFEDRDDEEFNNNIRHIQGMRKAMVIQSKHGQINAKSKNSNPQSSHAAVGHKNEWTQRRKSEKIFQSKCSVAPSQVLRYAYGGSPLWCYLPAPPADINSVPDCNICKTQRVFECQIMPALICYVEDYLNQLVSINTVTSKDFSDDFDFGVVCIWCCPNSCNDCKIEVAVVQPSADFA